MNCKTILIQCTAVLLLLVLLSIPVKGKAGNSDPVHPVTDTLPPANQPTVEPDKKQASSPVTTEVIKQVPKSRRQVKPVALPPAGIKVPVRPKIIKPQIRKVTGLIP